MKNPARKSPPFCVAGNWRGRKKRKSETSALEGERQFRCRRHVATLHRKEGGGYVVIGRKRLIVTESHTSIFQTGGGEKKKQEGEKWENGEK